VGLGSARCKNSRRASVKLEMGEGYYLVAERKIQEVGVSCNRGYVSHMNYNAKNDIS
jgi:hypothetical protein